MLFLAIVVVKNSVISAIKQQYLIQLSLKPNDNLLYDFRVYDTQEVALFYLLTLTSVYFCHVLNKSFNIFSWVVCFCMMFIIYSTFQFNRIKDIEIEQLNMVYYASLYIELGMIYFLYLVPDKVIKKCGKGLLITQIGLALDEYFKFLDFMNWMTLLEDHWIVSLVFLAILWKVMSGLLQNEVDKQES